jgi:hypothetical protein
VTAPIFRGVQLLEPAPDYYCGRIADCHVQCWRVVYGEDDGRLGSRWFASSTVRGVIIGAPGGAVTASLALRALLTELNRVHRKLGKLLEPVAKRKKARKRG